MASSSTPETAATEPPSTTNFSAPKPLDVPSVIASLITPTPQSYSSGSFVLASSICIFQLSSGKVILVEDTAARTPAETGDQGKAENERESGRRERRRGGVWFLPRGRKDIGETLEQCAVREGFEEAGYTARLLRLPLPTLQPCVPNSPKFLSHSEPFHVHTLPYAPQHSHSRSADKHKLYMCFYFLGAIADTAARSPTYGSNFVGKHEAGYNSALVDIHEAVDLLSGGLLRLETRTANGSESRVLAESSTGNVIQRGDIDPGMWGCVEAAVVGEAWAWLKAFETHAKSASGPSKSK